jgi:hypothetical protein
VRAAELYTPSAVTNQEIAPATDDLPKDNDENTDENTEEVEYDDPALSSHDRHSRKCVICHHPDRVGIE